MKYFFCFFTALTLSCFSKHTSKSPPNCKFLYDSIFIDTTNIYTFHYGAFLFWTNKYFEDSSSKFLSLLPYRTNHKDFECYTYWEDPDVNSLQESTIFHSNIPMIGITYQQALAHTQWRTDRVLERQLLIKKHIRKKDYTPDKQPFNIHNAKIFYPELTTKDIYYYEFSLPDSVHIAQSYDSISIFKEIYRIKDYLFKTTKSDSTFNTLSFYQFTSDSLKVYDLQNRIMKPINTIDCKRDLIFLKNISTIKKL